MTGTTRVPKPARLACWIAIVATVVFTLAYITFVVTRGDDGADFADSSGTMKAALVVLYGASAVAAIRAASQTLAGSNSWRITLIVFSSLALASGLMTALSLVYVVLSSDGDIHHANYGGQLWMLPLAAVMITAAAVCIVLLSLRNVRDWFRPVPPPMPVGWYPGPNGQMQWWTGTTWAAAIPPPTDPHS